MKVIKKKLLGVFACMLLLCAVGQMCVGKEIFDVSNDEPLVTLLYEPHSHDFGDMLEGETDSTIFEIWRGGGCCALTYTLYEDYGWIDVFPTSGESHGERDPITVTINTTGLAPASYEGKIKITSNGGSGTFDVAVNIIVPYPSLSYAPHSHDFGDMDEGETDSTIFEIWNKGVDILTYTLTEDCGWVDVSPTSGESTGEHDPIAVSIDTTGLDIGLHTYDVYIESNGGNGAFTVTVTVTGTSEIEVEISGGLGVTATIKNVGDVDAASVEWSITFDGGFILIPSGGTANGTIDIPAGEEFSVKIFVLGIGETLITATAECDESSDTEEQDAFVFLFIIIML